MTKMVENLHVSLVKQSPIHLALGYPEAVLSVLSSLPVSLLVEHFRTICVRVCEELPFPLEHLSRKYNR